MNPADRASDQQVPFFDGDESISPRTTITLVSHDDNFQETNLLAQRSDRPEAQTLSQAQVSAARASPLSREGKSAIPKRTSGITSLAPYRMASVSSPPSTPAPSGTRAGSKRTPTPTASVRSGSRIPSLMRPSPTNARANHQHDSSNPVMSLRTAAIDKPLPSRPVGSIINGPSPSKNSRGLIDASEQSLSLEWPALAPRSVSTPEHSRSTPSRSSRPAPSLIPRKAVPSNAIVTTSSGPHSICKTRDSKLSMKTDCSSAVSFVSAVENEECTDWPGAAGRTDVERDRYEIQKQSAPATSRRPIFPARKDSLQHPETFTEGTFADKTVVNDLWDCGASVSDTNMTTTTASARPSTQCAPPANFSRPRPSSFSNAYSDAQDSGASSESSNAHQRTASRIPITGLQMPTLVDISTANTLPLDDSQPDVSPSYGARHLMSPNSPELRDEGAKRRQNKAADICDNITYTACSSVTDSGLSESDPAGCSTPNFTADSSSPELVEASTPAHSPRFNGQDRHQDHHSSSPCRELSHRQIPTPWLENEERSIRPPPSCSPFTGPLQTIPSQTVLPVSSEDLAPPTCQESTSSRDLSDLVQEYSQFDEGEGRRSKDYPSRTNATCGAENETHQTPSSFCESNDESPSQSSSHRHRTLSLLEGQGTPPVTAVTSEALIEYLEKNNVSVSDRRRVEQSRTSTLFDKMTAAQRFLDGQQDPTQDVHEDGEALVGYNKARKESSSPQRTCESNMMTQYEAVDEPLLQSTWSNTTPSAVGQSQPVSGRPGVFRSLVPPSIGYPSALTSHPPDVSYTQQVSTSDKLPSRSDSPTLGASKTATKAVPGSVKAARDRLRSRSKGYTSATLSTHTKQTTKSRQSPVTPMPTNKSPRRGRRNSVENSQTRIVDSGVQDTRRSRSRGRIVMDKFTGLFSGPRRQQQVVPPVPSLPAIPPDVPRGLIKHNATLRSPEPQSVQVPDVASQPIDVSDAADQTLQQALVVADTLHAEAQKVSDSPLKLRMLEICQGIIASVTSAKEAQVHAEKAQQAARDAKSWTDLALKNAEMIIKNAPGLQMAAKDVSKHRR